MRCFHLLVAFSSLSIVKVNSVEAVLLQEPDNVNMNLPALELLQIAHLLLEKELSNLQKAVNLASCQPRHH